ncbi:MAG: hypothetical protein H0X12_02505 [Nocardioides sp.]|nr:hypothetical protein [Nocardioides sp.]
MRRLLLVLPLLALAGCGTATVAEPESAAPTAREEGVRLPPVRGPSSYTIDDPPEFHVVTASGEQLDLRPWTICITNGCADGAPDDDNLPKVGSPDSVTFGFDLAGWTFEDVRFRELGPCPRHITVAAEKVGPRSFRIDPAGPAGRWAVDISGRGPAGDAVTTIEWRTPTAGQLPEQATGSAAVLADHDGVLDSYGVEVYLADLDRPYSPDAATITVTGSNRDSVELTAARNETGKTCYSAGDLAFVADDAEGRRAIDVGPGPFNYSARVRLGDTTYVGTGTWPEGETEEIAPHVPLTWDPPLPVYAG